MWPTRANGNRSSIPSRMPPPARRIDTRHSFLPASNGKLPRSSGVSISVTASGSSRVASYANSRLISRSSRRNSAVDVFRSRISDSLCWTSGCSTTVTLDRGCCMTSFLEQGAVADDRERRSARRPAFERDLSSSRPTAAFQHPCKGEILCAFAQPLAHTECELIKQCDRQRPPFDDGLAQRSKGMLQEGGIARLDHAAIDEEAAIAVFGKAG